MASLISKLKQRARLLKRESTALYFAYRDPRTPWHARIFATLVVAYMLSPIDLIPDFIPVIGYLDDLILVPLGISLALKMIPKEVIVDARQRANDPQQIKGLATVFSIFAICIWALVIYFIARIIYQFITNNT